jgi:hypothetical protein
MPVASALAAPVLALVALALQPTDDEGPVSTAPPSAAASDPVPGLEEAPLDLPPPAAAAKTLTVESKTLVQGQTLQVVLGQRALFMLDDKGWPVLLKVEEGQLAAAHPDGAVEEAFAPPPPGQFAVALDGSAEVRATVLKVWNETDQALDYSAIALVMTKGEVTPAPAPVCAVPAHSIRTETWRRPIVAAGLGRFQQTAKAKACREAG